MGARKRNLVLEKGRHALDEGGEHDACAVCCVLCVLLFWLQ